jgi:predicted nucleic acid-binding protein
VIVIDASLAVKLYFNESGSEQAIGLIHSHAGEISVPDIFAVEVASALVRQANMDDDNVAVALDCLANFARLINGDTLTLVRPTARDITTAADIAIDIGHPLRDCLYLLLAVQLGCPLVTFDAKFAARANAYHAQIQLLTP